MRQKIDGQTFVDVIRRVVRDSAADGVMNNLQHPPGRKPSEVLLEQSKWYNNLNDADRQIVDSVIIDSVNHAVFGFFCVLDGARAIENGAEKGVLELYYRKSTSKILLNAPEGPTLHDLL